MPPQNMLPQLQYMKKKEKCSNRLQKKAKHAKIEKNIVFVGAGKQIRIWAEEVWNEREQNRNYDKMREIMRQYGL